MCHNTGPEFSLCACAVLPASNIRRKMSRVLALLSVIYLASAASDVRLVNLDGSYDTQVGRVEVYLHNKWGQVCGDGFSSVDAGVVCTSLGYAGYGGLETSNQGIGNLSIVIGYVDCSGQETSILQCSYRLEKVRYKYNNYIYFCTESKTLVVLVLLVSTAKRR